MDREASLPQLYNSDGEEASGIESEGEELSRDGEDARKEVDEDASMESKTMDSLAVEVSGDDADPDKDMVLEDTLKISERSDEEDIVDVSPSGCTLSSLALAKPEDAAKVKNMFVFDNTFTVLPSSIKKFKSLKKLKFFSNEVRTLPQELGDMEELEHLYLKISSTGLGSLPSFEKLKALKALELHQVPARPSSSSLSREIAQLHSLTRLSVCHFSISLIPVEIGNLQNLEELDLSFNKLKALPKELAGLNSLKTLKVASNKLVDLPSELRDLTKLTNIDVSHNRITSLSALQLVFMTSLRVLNVQFNKLKHIDAIPEWINCILDGNDGLQFSDYIVDKQVQTSFEEHLLDWEPPISVDLPDNIHGGGNLSLLTPGSWSSPSSKVQPMSRGRKGWKQDSQQHKARQDRLNSSRKYRSENHGEASETTVAESKSDPANINIRIEDQFTEQVLQDHSPLEPGSSGAAKKQMESGQPYPGVKMNGRDGSESERVGQDEVSIPCIEGLQTDDPCEESKITNVEEGNFRARGLDHSPSAKLDIFQSEASTSSVNEAISGDRCEQEVRLEGYQENDVKEAQSESLNSWVSVAGVKAPRRQDSMSDRNPKPSKRRRSVKEFSEVSMKYCRESFVGIDDRLHDGFYDAGRDRPFLPLEVLEKEHLCFESREVILVDREKDEELDVIALSAQQLLAGLEMSRKGVQKVNPYQRMATLALFVSDCFGGSDKTHSISNMRRAALGGSAGMPFFCSCSANISGISINKLAEKTTTGTVLPSVDMLCEGAVRFLKAQQGSNILPLGSFPYGVCRHRAILFKYLCDRADPVIPCELVRGYLDYMPHAWNVVLMETASGGARMLVDTCRPLDIRQEQDAEYFCRYIPLKRIHLPSAAGEGQKGFSDDFRNAVLHEDIGHGASGAVVQRCTFGTFTAAAKVRQLEAIAEGPGGGKRLENTCLSELRLLCSLQRHPCLVSFYGHQLSSGMVSSSDSVEVPPQPPQLIIFMEYIRGGSLEGFLQGLAKKGKQCVPPKLALHVAKNIACALTLVHAKGIIHRDIKSSNVLIDFDGQDELGSSAPIVKLCDFDSAVPLQSSSAHTCYLAHRGVPSADVCVGTPRWIAPEVLRAMYGRHSYGLEADLWSFGCLLAELLTLKVPYDGLTETEVHSSIQVGQRPHLSPQLEILRSQSSGANELVTHSADDFEALSTLVSLFYSCTDPTPSKRPSAKDAFSALSSAIAGRACTTSALDGKIEEPAVGPEIPAMGFVSKLGEDTLSSTETVCPVCSRAKDSCSCQSGSNSELSSDPSESASSSKGTGRD